MMEYVSAAAFIGFCGWLNRFRGGGWPHWNLPGGPAIGPALMLWLLATALFGWLTGIVSGLGYLLWAVWGWGAYIDMGRSGIKESEIGWIDCIVRPRLGHGFCGDLAGWALRQAYALPFFATLVIFGAPPLAAFALFVAFTALVCAAYVIAFRFMWPDRVILGVRILPTVFAETVTGLVWGGSITIMAGLAT